MIKGGAQTVRSSSTFLKRQNRLTKYMIVNFLEQLALVILRQNCSESHFFQEKSSHTKVKS
jgi:hypothetical protein